MAQTIEQFLDRIKALQEEMEAELAKKRAAFRYRLENGRVEFEDEVRRAHRAARVRLGAFLAATRPMVVLTAPVIYSLIVPFVLLDLFVSLYQAVCFPVYGIAKVRRGDHISIDRHHLAYLNGLQKLNCLYCGYCNGLISYVREVAGRTEQYWCPIKHARRLEGTHGQYHQFVEFGDADGFRDQSAGLRAALRQGEKAPPPGR